MFPNIQQVSPRVVSLMKNYNSHQSPGNNFKQKEQQYFIFLQINVSQKRDWECLCTFNQKKGNKEVSF